MAVSCGVERLRRDEFEIYRVFQGPSLSYIRELCGNEIDGFLFDRALCVEIEGGAPNLRDDPRGEAVARGYSGSHAEQMSNQPPESVGLDHESSDLMVAQY